MKAETRKQTSPYGSTSPSTKAQTPALLGQVQAKASCSHPQVPEMRWWDHQRDAGMCAWVTREYLRHTPAFHAPLPSLHVFFFFFSPTTSSKRFCFSSSTWETLLPTPNCHPPASGLQMARRTTTAFSDLPVSENQSAAVQISVLFAVTFKNDCLNCLLSPTLYPLSTFISI